MKITITGHTDLSREDFEKYYVPVIRQYLGCSFNLGAADGVDKMAYEYLLEHSQDVTVYQPATKRFPGHILPDTPRDITAMTYTERDDKLRSDSDILIGFVRGDFRSLGSGSARNIAAYRGYDVTDFYEFARDKNITAKKILRRYPLLAEHIIG